MMTTYIALYGAILSTGVMLWNVYVFRNSGPKLDIETNCLSGADKLHRAVVTFILDRTTGQPMTVVRGDTVRIRNIGKQPTTVEDWGLVWSDRWFPFFRTFQRGKTKSSRKTGWVHEVLPPGQHLDLQIDSNVVANVPNWRRRVYIYVRYTNGVKLKRVQESSFSSLVSDKEKGADCG